MGGVRTLVAPYVADSKTRHGDGAGGGNFVVVMTCVVGVDSRIVMRKVVEMTWEGKGGWAGSCCCICGEGGGNGWMMGRGVCVG